MFNTTEHDMFNTSDLYSAPGYRVADITIGIIYLSCFVFGLPSNLISIFYFRKRFRNVDIPTFLYTLTAINDAIVCFLVLNSGLNFLALRKPWLVEFCATHHVLFQMSQRLSVFLVAVLSMTRTYIVLFPLRRVSKKKIVVVVCVFWVGMTCFFVVPAVAGLTNITYHWEGGYCWAEPVPGSNISKTWDQMDNAFDCVGLAFPVLPITISCILSTHKIVSSRKRRLDERNLSRRSKLKQRDIKSKRNATTTIILVTALYIISNIPLFVNYVLYLITIVCYEYPGPFYSSRVMYFYSWNCTAILSTALNSAANPVVYITRIKKYRRWVHGVFCHGAGPEDGFSEATYGMTIVNRSGRPSMTSSVTGRPSVASSVTERISMNRRLYPNGYNRNQKWQARVAVVKFLTDPKAKVDV